MEVSPFCIWLTVSNKKSLPLGEAAHTPELESDLTSIRSQAEISPRAEELAARKDIGRTDKGLDGHHFLQDRLELENTIPQDG